MELGIGTATGAKDIAGQRAVISAWWDSKGTVIVPRPGVCTGDWDFPVPTLPLADHETS